MSSYEDQQQELLERNPNYQAAREWAKAHWSDAELARYNALIGQPATRDEGLNLLLNTYAFAKAAAAAAQAQTPQPPEARDPNLFYSQPEVAAAMKDPRYRTDGRYREEIAWRVHQSKDAGTLETSGRFYTQARETVSHMPDRMPGFHEAERQRQEAERRAERAAELKRQAEALERADEIEATRKANTRWTS
jgi:hypothetical protein